MAWLPSIRVAGWLMTGRDGPEGSYRYATRHIFVRLSQLMDGSGRWTLQVADTTKGVEGNVIKTYANEDDSRQALTYVHRLGLLLGTLVDRYDMSPQPVRWELTERDLEPAQDRHLSRSVRSQAGRRPRQAPGR